MRTEQEIERQIKALKKMKSRLPEINGFNENNWERIDAQVDILSGRRRVADFVAPYDAEQDEDETDEGLESAVLEAEAWLMGHSNDDLSDEEDFEE
jgi:hypothetical protein